MKSFLKFLLCPFFFFLVSTGMLLNPKDGPPKLPPVQILPPTMSTVVHPPVPVVVPSLSPPVDPTALPPSFASAARDPHRSETLPELLERLDLDSADSLRKYTKKILHEMVDECQDSIQVGSFIFSTIITRNLHQN